MIPPVSIYIDDSMNQLQWSTVIYSLLILYICIYYTHIPHDTVNHEPFFHIIVDHVSHTTLVYLPIQCISYTNHHTPHSIHQSVIYYCMSITLTTTALTLLFTLCGAFISQLYCTILLSLICSVFLCNNTLCIINHMNTNTKSLSQQQLIQSVMSFSIILSFTYIGMFPLALDWDQQYQLYPLSSIVTTCMGYNVHTIVEYYHIVDRMGINSDKHNIDNITNS